MKRLPQQQRGLRSNIHKYLIETDTCLAEAIDDVILEMRLKAEGNTYGMGDVPTEYPYIALIGHDSQGEYIDLAFVTMSDFTEHSDEGSLKAELDKLYNETTMSPWIARIQQAILNDDREIEFRDLDDESNPDNQYAVNDHQIRYIRDKGYTVTWEKYPRSYVVSGW